MPHNSHNVVIVFAGLWLLLSQQMANAQNTNSADDSYIDSLFASLDNDKAKRETEKTPSELFETIDAPTEEPTILRTVPPPVQRQQSQSAPATFDPNNYSYTYSNVFKTGSKSTVEKNGDEGETQRTFQQPREQLQSRMSDLPINLDHIPEEFRSKISNLWNSANTGMLNNNDNTFAAFRNSPSIDSHFSRSNTFPSTDFDKTVKDALEDIKKRHNINFDSFFN